MENEKKKKQPKSKVLIKPKININLDKTKAKVDMKLGDKINAQIQGYGKTKNIITSSNKLKGAGVKGKIQYTQGKHSISGQGSFKPNRKKNKSVGLIYQYKF
jgi:hypothetical protein